MNEIYGRDLDLNLLRVFAVVADAGSVTAAASRLYLTQPAVSAALRRLATTVGAPLFSRKGRGLALTARGERLVSEARPHLAALVSAALSPSAFDARTSDRTLRLGLADTMDGWLLGPLLRALDEAAPHMRLIVLPVQFRTVGEALSSRRVDMAVTVADELPAGTRRETLFLGGFVCLHDPRHTRLGKAVTRARYLEHEHVIVSYNGDLRGVVEDALGVHRKVRCSVSSFHSVGAVVEGSKLLATVPELVARTVRCAHPALRVSTLPFEIPRTPMELVWPEALDDEASRFLRGLITRVAKASRASAPRVGGGARRGRSR